MGKIFDGIDDRLAEWIGRQRLFFVGTAPSGDSGHVNVSPKGPIESLRVLDPRTVAYLDLVGSGAETIAHLRQNGRIVIMLCAFEGPPRIVRLYGQGTVVVRGQPEFDQVAAGFRIPDDVESRASRRSVVRVDVERIADSCGYGVPLMDFRGLRPQQAAWVANKLAHGGQEALAAYVTENNAESLDGLPAVETTP